VQWGDIGHSRDGKSLVLYLHLLRIAESIGRVQYERLAVTRVPDVAPLHSDVLRAYVEKDRDHYRLDGASIVDIDVLDLATVSWFWLRTFVPMKAFPEISPLALKSPVEVVEAVLRSADSVRALRGHALSGSDRRRSTGLRR